MRDHQDVYQRLAESRDLLGAYAELSRLYSQIMTDDPDLGQATANLCELLRRVESDGNFWTTLAAFEATYDRPVEAFNELLASGELAAQEYRLLVENGMDEQTASGLVSVFATWVSAQTGAAPTSEVLRARIRALGEAVCQPAPPEPRSGQEPRRGRHFWRVVRIAGRVGLVVGGGVLVVGNAIGAATQHIDHNIADYSITAGKVMMAGGSFGGHEV